ncbi:hypothetical protein ACQFN5_28575 (plasmid) [Klebsiella sp. WOUb02]|uniref:hypothetical protein n=1 Tax=Klebsiella sp. WOUb02 TaxID=3161071 RepID=UPI003CED2FDB
MTYAIFMVVTALCAFGLNILTSKIGTGASQNIRGDGTEGMTLRCIISFILLLVALFLPIKPAVIHLGVEFAALVNFIASVVLYTLAGIKVKWRLKKQRKAEKAAQKR